MKIGLLVDNFMCSFALFALFFDQIWIWVLSFSQIWQSCLNWKPNYIFEPTLECFASKGKLSFMKNKVLGCRIKKFANLLNFFVYFLSYPLRTRMLTPPLKHSSQTLTGQGRANWSDSVLCGIHKGSLHFLVNKLFSKISLKIRWNGENNQNTFSSTSKVKLMAVSQKQQFDLHDLSWSGQNKMHAMIELKKLSTG